jgi:hypothetical protein
MWLVAVCANRGVEKIETRCNPSAIVASLRRWFDFLERCDCVRVFTASICESARVLFVAAGDFPGRLVSALDVLENCLVLFHLVFSFRVCLCVHLAHIIAQNPQGVNIK